MNRHSGLCKTFELLARKVWGDLSDASHFNMSLGEEGITDNLLLSLKRASPMEIIINKFNRLDEGKTTGADWEWWFCGKGQAFGMRVQAKKLDPLKLKYDRLNRPMGRSRRKQINALLDDASRQSPPLFPIYCFYNYWNSPKALPRWNCGSFPPDWVTFGCSVCDARLVRRCLYRGIDDLERIGSISYPWMCLVCCTGYCSPQGSLPERARGVAGALSGASFELLPIRIENPSVPPLVSISETPRYVRVALEGELTQSAVTDYFYNRPIDGLLIVREE